MIYEPTANPAKNFGAFSKKILNKAEELGTDKIEFIDDYIKYLKGLINGEKVETYEEISLLANVPEDFLIGLIKYLEKIKARYQALTKKETKKEANKDKKEKEKEEVIKDCSKIFQTLREKTSSLEEQLTQLNELLEERGKQKGKFNKVILEEIQKEIAKVQEAIKEKKRKDREIKEKRDDWHQFLDSLIGKKANSMAVLDYLNLLLEREKNKNDKYSKIAIEEIEKAIRHAEAEIEKSSKEIEREKERKDINRNRQYLMNILYFTNGFVSIAQNPLISEFGRTFSLDISEFDRFSRLNEEIRGELRTTEEDQIKSLVENKIKGVSEKDRKEIIEAVEEVLQDKECEEVINEMKVAETKIRLSKRTLNGGYKIAQSYKQEYLKDEAKKDLLFAENMKKDIEYEDSPAALKINKVLSSDIATDILVLKLREKMIEKSKSKFAGKIIDTDVR